MLSILTSTTILPLLNHLLRGGAGARERLKPWAGNIVCFDVFPLTLNLEITGDGLFAVSDASATPAVFIRLNPFQAARLLLKDPAAFRTVSMDGDVQLAAAVGSVLRGLSWDAEADLSRLVGDIAAHRIAGGARSLHHWQRNTFISAGQSITEYVTEERPLLAKQRQITQFIGEVDSIRDDVARLEKRLRLLDARRS